MYDYVQKGKEYSYEAFKVETGLVPGNPLVLAQWVDQTSFPSWCQNTKEFYKRLRFMVFKVKQKAKKDYESYKDKQIAITILDKARQTNAGKNIRVGGLGDRLNKIEAREVIGSNWPYDYFSLIESIKLDVELEVEQ